MFLVRPFLINSSERFIETIFIYILHSRYYWPHHQNQHQHIIDCYNWDHHCVWSNHSLVQHQCLPSRGPTISSLLFWTFPDNWWWWWWNFKLKKRHRFTTKIVRRQDNVNQHSRVFGICERGFCIWYLVLGFCNFLWKWCEIFVYSQYIQNGDKDLLTF